MVLAVSGREGACAARAVADVPPHLSSTGTVTTQITGGELGGLLDFRNQVLDSAKAAIGRVVIGAPSAVLLPTPPGDLLNPVTIHSPR
jgi:hypothetical protein